MRCRSICLELEEDTEAEEDEDEDEDEETYEEEEEDEEGEEDEDDEVGSFFPFCLSLDGARDWAVRNSPSAPS